MTTEHTLGELRQEGALLFFANRAGGFSVRDCPVPQANARRLAATWNACQGISTESLEANGVTSFEAAVVMTRQQATLRAQRNELLAELGSIAAFAVGEGDVCEIIAKRARAIIAKIGGTA